MRKRIELEIELYGDGAIHEQSPGTFVGGVPDPDLSGLSYTVHVERSDDRPEPFEGKLQINLYGTSEGYREFARYLLALAELDVSADPEFHDHQDELVSKDGKTLTHLIFRK